VATSIIRPIRSYVLRQGRTTPAQKRALDELYPKHGIAFSSEKLTSPRGAPLVLEIGSGMGETTIAIAKAHPEADFVAVEVHGPGVGSLLNAVEREKLANVRVVRHDAVEVLEQMIAAEALLEQADGAFAKRPLTKFESRGQRLGHSIRDLYFRRRQKAPAAR